MGCALTIWLGEEAIRLQDLSDGAISADPMANAGLCPASGMKIDATPDHHCTMSHQVRLSMQDILLMVGPYGDWVKYSLDESVELVTEIDGVRPSAHPACFTFL